MSGGKYHRHEVYAAHLASSAERSRAIAAKLKRDLEQLQRNGSPVFCKRVFLGGCMSQTTVTYGGVVWEVEYDFEDEEPCQVFEDGMPLEPSYPACVIAHEIKVGGFGIMEFLDEHTIEALEEKILMGYLR
jgi:hypothetical protein